METLPELYSALVGQQVNIGNQLVSLICQRVTANFNQELVALEDVKHLLVQLLGIDKKQFTLETQFPVAYSSNDHIYPRGTKNDNTRSARFVAACEAKFKGRPLNYLDLGCAGGGLVFDFLLKGHSGFGLEGSDYSLKWKRAEWGRIPNSLRTCDITHPFEIKRDADGSTVKFDVVTMWEVFEHIPESLVPEILLNVKKHMHDDSYFVGSIALFDDVENGVSWHPTVKPKEWWRQMFLENGFKMFEYEFFEFSDHCRGVGGCPGDNHFRENPELGFHFTARLVK